MTIKHKILALSLLGSIMAPAHSSIINFACITGNDSSGASCTIAENQMAVDITDATFIDSMTGDTINRALFTFTNIGMDLESYISDVYFIDGTLFGISSIDNSDTGVQFSEGANPSNLPGYSATASFSADSDAGAFNGVQAGEYLGITFDLLSGVSFADTLAALDTGALVIGIHAQGLGADLDDSYSESLISVVPVPAAVWLFGSGLIGLAGFMRRRKI